VSWIQYPRVRRVGPRPAVFKHQMPWYLRMALAVFGLALMVGSAVVLLALAGLVWAALMA